MTLYNEMNEMILSAKNLSLGYHGDKSSISLFEDQQLTLKRGELVCFMGPNGVGKSTLIRTLAGLQKPLAGEITEMKPHSIGLVLTDKLSASNMTVYDLVSYGRYPFLGWSLSLQPKDKELIEQAIEQVRIQHLIDKRIFELSDGQLQMALIAKALAQDTPVILLDEPTAHLDLNNRVEIMNLLRIICREQQKAILVATHELDLALQTSDCIWLATGNKTIKTGIPEDLVLDGSFDDVFQFKGFDLKTGKVQHQAFRNVSVKLEGEGYAYLWTKNALERSGFDVSDQSQIVIRVNHLPSSPIEWVLKANQKNIGFQSIKSLLSAIG